MVGYAYINPLAIPLCYRGLCLHQPLSGVDRSHSESRAHHGMVGYAYINPLAIPLCYRGLCLHQPLSGVDPPEDTAR